MQTEKPLVSVIVLTYNHAKYIRQCLDSILMQNVDFSYEILVGDDASADETPAILREYQSLYPERIRLFIRETNIGAAQNAYKLLLQAQGDYLAFCEGDDYWLDNEKLKKQICFLEERTEYIGCTHPCLVVDEFGNAMQNQHLSWVKEKDNFCLDDFKGIYLPGQTATIVKRNIFLDKNDPYPFLYQLNRNISDRTATLLYLSLGNFGRIPQIMSAYRRAEHTGITNQLYKTNKMQIRQELLYTDQLSVLSQELTGRKDVFESYYEQLYAWSLLWFVKKPCRFHYETVKLTAMHYGRGIVHPIVFFRGICQRLRK